MNRDEAIRRAEIAMAWALGEAEVQTCVGHDEWKTINPPETVKQQQFWAGPPFFDDATQWRIKPKPLECWVWVIENVAHNAVMNCTDKPISPPRGCMVDGRWVRMVEKQ